MRTSMKMFATLLLVVMCLLANEMGGPMVVEGRTCLTKSHKFKGPCLGDTNCKNVCRKEMDEITGKNEVSHRKNDSSGCV
ncbi:Defensin SD2 [Artemisia annua]|uniref:Defensin SD2 n=1 Tax=Artemisia annua TaxID=35608 RepID=A0A2U1M3G0_ARTAN|nr:Defensin SD2 [Artemisia annua]